MLENTPNYEATLEKINKERKLEEGEAINIETFKELLHNKGDENGACSRCGGDLCRRYLLL